MGGRLHREAHASSCVRLPAMRRLPFINSSIGWGAFALAGYTVSCVSLPGMLPPAASVICKAPTIALRPFDSRSARMERGPSLSVCLCLSFRRHRESFPAPSSVCPAQCPIRSLGFRGAGLGFKNWAFQNMNHFCCPMLRVLCLSPIPPAFTAANLPLVEYHCCDHQGVRVMIKRINHGQSRHCLPHTRKRTKEKHITFVRKAPKLCLEKISLCASSSKYHDTAMQQQQQKHRMNAVDTRCLSMLLLPHRHVFFNSVNMFLRLCAHLLCASACDARQ